MKTYATMILGCKVNDYEAHSFKEAMDKEYLEVSFKEKADIYVIFTCCVTNTAESKTRKFIRQARRANPDAYIVAVGCYAQTGSDNKVFEEVDLIVGSKHKKDLKTLIDKHIKDNLVEDLSDVSFEDMYIDHYKGKTRAFLKIQDGCNQFCSYCIIPYARGKERSMRLEDALMEARRLANSSKEIVLTGIHTGRYFDGRHDLSDLLKELLKIDGLFNIRLSSIEVTEISEEIIEMLAKKGKLAPHLHIPLQSGSDKILKLMDRPYTLKDFKELVFKIREKVEGISISTDLIVGFPNETEKDFKDTLDFLKELKFSFIHVFPYALKKGTKAASFKDQVSEDVKKQRVKMVMELDRMVAQPYYDSFVGKAVEVLVERSHDGYSFGHSREYVEVKIKGQYTNNQIVRVKISKCTGRLLYGEVYETE